MLYRGDNVPTRNREKLWRKQEVIYNDVYYQINFKKFINKRDANIQKVIVFLSMKL